MVNVLIDMVEHPLIRAEDSILLVIDVQPAFLHKLAPIDRQPLLGRIRWLIGVARYLEIPTLVTAEDVLRLGGVDPAIEAALERDTIVHNKLIFNLADDLKILAGVEQSGRRTCIILGLETDVCVAQSTLGLLQRGYHVAVVADATASPGEAHNFGLQRIRDAGGVVLSVKGLFYEWIRTVERSRQFRRDCPDLVVPESVEL